MVGSQGQQHFVHQQNMFKVVDDAFSVQEIHRSSQKIPVQRFGKPKVFLLAGHIGNGNNLLEGDALDGRDHDDDKEVACAEGPEEGGNHDESPYGACNEVCLFLLILGLGRLLGGLT